MTSNQYDAIIISRHYKVGTNVYMEITVEHHRQHAPAKVVKLPFYEPEWKKK